MGAEDRDLLNQIAQLAGTINKHKQGIVDTGSSRRTPSYGGNDYYPTPYHSRGRGRGGYNNYGHFNSYNGRGRGGSRGGYRGSRGRPYQHRGHYSRPARPEPPKINKPCANFTRTGQCTQGLSCRYIHDSERVALCLANFNGRCTNPRCTLNHKSVEQNSPMCEYSARGRCTRANCKYTHMKNLSDDAKICQDFAVGGWCDKGANCLNMHVFECPDFVESGTCPRDRCHLQHIVRATNRPRTESPAPSNKVDVDALLDGLMDDTGSEEEGSDTGDVAHSDNDDEQDDEDDEINEDETEEIALAQSDFDEITPETDSEANNNHDEDFIEL